MAIAAESKDPKDYHSLLKEALAALAVMRNRVKTLEQRAAEPIAIVGMSCRLPGGANSPELYWKLLQSGKGATTEIPKGRWDVDAFYDEDFDAPGKSYSRFGCFVDDVQHFDAQFFRISPREAMVMDPQQRLVLQTVWETLEAACIPAERLVRSRTGVFLGMSTSDYSDCIADRIGMNGDAYVGTGNAVSVSAGRVSYYLGLHGPALTIDTACSSSLVAVHLACQSLRNQECDAALAGGVNLMLSPALFVNFAKARMLAPDGLCKTFDAAADGYVRGEGAGMLLLKRLSDAQAAGDRILAVVRGTAVNQDGRSGGLTVPNGSAQQAVVRAALASGGIEPQDVDYIEAHGTGTALGDPIELDALGAVFRAQRPADRRLWVASAKTNIGHLEAAAGVAGLIKVILALQHEQIPAHLHFERPTPHVDWDQLLLQVPSQATPWPAGARRRLAGVSSFGFSGTNAHVVLEEAPRVEPRTSACERPRHLLTLSAKTAAAVNDLAGRYVRWFEEHPQADVASAAYTANVGRTHFDHRLCIQAATVEEAARRLAAAARGETAEGVLRGEGPKSTAPIAFLFTGQGSQYVGMGKELFATQPVFRRVLTQCDEILRQYLPQPLLEVLYPAEGVTSPLNETAYTQPALFALEYALAEMWKSWGIEPAYVAGHSVGEYVAACRAGVFSLEDGLKLIAGRARRMQDLPAEGGMAAVAADADRVLRFVQRFPADISVAAFNGPRQVVISGRREALDAILAAMQAEGVSAQRLTVSHAFHSALMEPMLASYAELCREVPMTAPRLPLISNLSGAPAGQELTTADYWCRHIRQPVRWASCMQALAAEGVRMFVEIGPNPTLLGLGMACLQAQGEAENVWLPSLRARRGEWETLLESLGQLYARGVHVDWQGFDREYAREKLSLPTYAFQGQRYWVDMLPASMMVDRSATGRASLIGGPAAGAEAAAEQPSPAAEASGTQPGNASLYYGLQWQAKDRAASASAAEPAPASTWLLFADASGTAAALAERLARAGGRCVLVQPGTKTRPLGADGWQLDPEDAAGYRDVLAAAAGNVELPLRGVVHLWSLDAKAADATDLESLRAAQRAGCSSVLLLSQALLQRKDLGACRLWLVTRDGQPVTGTSTALASSAVWGFGRVLALEHPEIWGGMVDLAAGEASDKVACLVDEIFASDGEDQVAFRATQRYVPRLVRSELHVEDKPVVVPDASYLITGGLGALGLRIAHWLVGEGARHLVLVGRRGIATEEARQGVEALRAAGAEVCVVAADVADPEGMAAIQRGLSPTAPPLRGVIHAAGVSEVDAVPSMTCQRLAEVMQPKVLGAWNLHQMTLDKPLDFFVCFSSIASVWGSVRQAHYAAANSFLDALAHYRRSLGLPAVAINWGPWKEGGMATATARMWLGKLGVKGLPPQRALDSLKDCLRNGTVQCVVADVDWNRFKAVYQAKGRRPLLDEIHVAADGPAGGVSEAVVQLQALPAEDRPKRLLTLVQQEVAAVLGFPTPDAADPHSGLFDLGMDSLMSVELKQRLQARFGITLPTTMAFDYPNIEKLSGYLMASLFAGDAAAAAAPARAAVVASQGGNEPIAIVALAARLPGAGGDLQRFWELLRDGVDAIIEVPAQRWDIDAYYDPTPGVPGKTYSRFGSFLDGVDQFDPRFFGISPRETISMDPQQRLLLEVCWEALERGACSPERMVESQTGVFIGVTSTEYARLLIESQGLDNLDSFFISGNSLNALAGRVSHVLELKGPSMVVDTACSSSLVAVHLACQSLRNGECDAALAGGSNLTLVPEATVAACSARMLTTDGTCKTFDASADGYVRGEGVGVVLLKRLRDAQAAGDPILAVIRGSAVNQQGSSSGLTVPNGPAQQAVVRAALAAGGLEPADVEYVEAHGTGTSLGDPIELEALGGVFRQGRAPDDRLWVGSIKTNIGHLEAAAGIAGLIKVVLALQNQHIPPHLHLEHPTPHVDWDKLPLRVPRQLVPWSSNGKRRVAGVSSFGFSGTNAHLVIEEAPPPAALPTNELERPRHVLALSAKSCEALDELIGRYSRYLQEYAAGNLADVAFTANTGRSHFNYRLCLQAQSAAEAAERLQRAGRNEQCDGVVRGSAPASPSVPVAFLFTGQGSQYVGMGQELYRTQPAFRQALQRCDAILRPYLEQPLLEVLYPAEGQTSPLNETAYTQPALFALEWSLAQMWKSWGIEPAWVMGHSVGEYVAACVAGVFSLDDALKLIAVRARLMQDLPPVGAMAAVTAEKERVLPWVERFADVSVAACNGPRQVVISGGSESIAAIVAGLEAEGIAAQRLTVSHAFHSPLMEPILEAYARCCREVAMSPPRIALVSNLTGALAGAEIATPEYWCRHIRQPVQWAAGMASLAEAGAGVFLEAGPKPTLLALGAACLGEAAAAKALWLPSLRPNRGAWEPLAESLSQLYVRGAKVDWLGFDRDYARRKLELPTYAFQRQSYWPKKGPGGPRPQSAAVRKSTDHPLLGTRLALPFSEEIRFQFDCSASTPPYMEDHRLFGKVIAPGASHLSMVLSAAGSALPGHAYAVEEVFFPQALFMEDGTAHPLQIAFTPKEKGHYTVRSMSLADPAQPNRIESWTLHATGEVRLLPAEKSGPLHPPVNVEELQQRCPTVVLGSDFYAGFWDLGYTLGSSFRWIDRVWRRDGEGLCRMIVPELREGLDDYLLHPGLIDSCFQSLAICAAAGQGPGGGVLGDTILIPFRVRQLRFYRRPEPGPLWCYGALTSDSKVPRGYLQLFDDQGNIVAEIDGYESRTASRAALLSSLAAATAAEEQDPRQWLVELAWREQPPAKTAKPAEGKLGAWLILADRAGVGQGLAEPLRQLGHACFLVHSGEAFAECGEHTYTVNAANRADFERLLSEVIPRTDLPWRGVVHLWALDANSSSALDGPHMEAELAAPCGGILHLLQAWMPLNWARWPRWWLVTRGAQAVGSGNEPVALAQSPVWGLGRVLAIEHPELACARLDLDPAQAVADAAACLMAELLPLQVDEDQIAYRGGQRHVARLMHHAGAVSRLDTPAEGAYRLALAEFGTVDNLTIKSAARRRPLSGEVEVEVRAAGLNFRDVLRALGMLREYEAAIGVLSASDAMFGLEYAGVITAVGPDITEFAEGDEVMGLFPGSISSHLTVPLNYVTHKPAELGFAEAVASSFVFMTALYALKHVAGLRRGERVLIHAAAGGVGQAAVQLAQKVGAEVFATASSGKWDALKAQGVQHVMNSRTLDFAEQVMQLTGGEGVDVVLNSLNGDFIPKSLSVLKPGGRFVEIGAIGIWDPEQVAGLRSDVTYTRFDMLQDEMEDPGRMKGLLLEVLEEFRDGQLRPVPRHEFPIAEAIQSFRLMTLAKNVGKVVLALERSAAAETVETPIRDDATYVITGGLGALGLQTAQWMADCGARHLVLVGRQGAASEKARQTIESLQGKDVSVHVAQADVGDPDQVRALFAGLPPSMPPVRGVLHAAGVLDDGLLVDQDWKQFSGPLRAKVAGAWNLHLATRDLPLDFFVQFSSVASLLGSPAQGNYAAGNAFLDALAQQRRREGRAGLSINWGPWAEVGMAARQNRRDQARWAAAGMLNIPVETGMKLLGDVLAGTTAQVGVVPANWPRMLERYQGLPLLRDLQPGGSAGGGRSDFLEKLDAEPPEKRRATLTHYVVSELVQVLGLNPNEPVPMDLGFFELGVDSLTTMELRSRFQRAFNCALPTTLTFNYPTLADLIHYFAESVLGLPDEAPPASSGDAEAEPADASAALEHLSTDEVADMIRQTLAEVTD